MIELFTTVLASLSLLTMSSNEFMIHEGNGVILDWNANTYDKCSINLFQHKDGNNTLDTHYSLNETYFIISWSTISNVTDSHSHQIVANIINSLNPTSDKSNAHIEVSKFDQNYYHVVTDDFNNDPNDIIFSFTNDANEIELHVFGADFSEFKSNKLLWSKTMAIHPISANNNDIYDAIDNHNIECIINKDNNQELIIMVYEKQYEIGNSVFSDIYMSTFDYHYVTKHMNNSLNNKESEMVCKHPLIVQSLSTDSNGDGHHLLITYIVNYNSIHAQIVNADDIGSLALNNDENIVKIIELGSDKTLKYYSTMALRDGGFAVLYSIDQSNDIYICILDDDGERVLKDENDLFVDDDAYPSTNDRELYSYAQMIELELNYILITFFHDDGNIWGEIYYLDRNLNDDHDLGFGFVNVDKINGNGNLMVSNVVADHHCIAYDSLNSKIMLAWLGDDKMAYKSFAFDVDALDGGGFGEVNSTEFQANITDERNFDKNNSDKGMDGSQVLLIVILTSVCFCVLLALIVGCLGFLVKKGELEISLNLTNKGKKKKYKNVKRERLADNEDMFDDDDDDDNLELQQSANDRDHDADVDDEIDNDLMNHQLNRKHSI